MGDRAGPQSLTSKMFMKIVHPKENKDLVRESESLVRSKLKIKI